MNDRETLASELYTHDRYIAHNPTLHEEDSPWKIGLLLPLLEEFVQRLDKPQRLVVLDCGGGKGLILKAVASHLKERFAIQTDKYALDLSPGMLEAQKQENPDLQKMLQENIGRTSLQNKEVDLTMMIDVIEHVSDPARAMAEIQRFSKYALFKVPLEDNLVPRLWNWARHGKPRREAAAGIGHINYYSFAGIKRDIEKHCGKVISSGFGNVFSYYRIAPHYQNRRGFYFKWNRALGEQLHRWSPRLSSGILFEDCAQLLVKCY